MYSKKYQTLQESYSNYYRNLYERNGRVEGREGRRFEYNQRHGRPLITPQLSQSRSSQETLGGGTYVRGPQRLPKSQRKYDRQVLSGVRAASKQEMQRARERMGIGENYDLYDIILSHLLDEGYADNVESAVEIVVNMSEEWRESIVEEVLDEGRADKKAPPEYRAKLRNARAGFITLSGANATEARRREHEGRRGEGGNIGGVGGSSYRYDDNADKDYPSFRVRGRGYA